MCHSPSFSLICRRFLTILAAPLLAALLVVTNTAIAQNMDVGAAAAGQFSAFSEAYREGGPAVSPCMGYLQAAVDASGSDALHKSSPNTVGAWLNNWCNNNPSRPFRDATAALIKESGGARAATSAAVVLLPAQAAPACTAGATKYCSGCSTTCAADEKPYCMAGSDSGIQPTCVNFAHCGCNKR